VEGVENEGSILAGVDSCGYRIRGGESPPSNSATRATTGVDEFSETYLIGEAPRFASTEKSEENEVFPPEEGLSGNFQIAADSAGQTLVDLRMAGHGRKLLLPPDQLTALHNAARETTL
jgi:hypothetical protein